jgi:hypothetical protein
MTRRFRINTHLTLPLDLYAAPGGVYACHEPGDEVDLDEERCRFHDRFIRGRIRGGDMTELEAESAAPDPAVLSARPSTAAAPRPATSASSGPFVFAPNKD